MKPVEKLKRDGITTAGGVHWVTPIVAACPANSHR